MRGIRLFMASTLCIAVTAVAILSLMMSILMASRGTTERSQVARRRVTLAALRPPVAVMT